MKGSSAQLDTIVELVNKNLGEGGRIEQIERRVHALSKTQDDGMASIQKAMLAGHANPGSVGWDGADTYGLITKSSRTKTVGRVAGKAFGEWLQHVAAANQQWNGARPLEQVNKAMGDFGSRAVTKAPNAESAGATGGYMVPPQFYAQLLKFVAEKSFIKAMTTTLPMQSATLQYPYLNQSGTTASSTTNYPGSNFFGGTVASWSPEASTAQASNSTFKQGELIARTLLVQTVSSMQLIQDSAIAIDGLITSLLADSVAWQLDFAVLRGTGVGMPLGILNAPGTIQATRTGGGSTFTLASVSNMISRVVLSDNFDGLIWVMHQSVLPQLIQMVNNTSSNASLVWINQYAGGASVKMPISLLGIPIYFTEKVPKLGTAGDVMLLDATKYLCGDRLAVQIEASPYPYFPQYQMVWRTVWRGDGQPWFDAPITLADGSGTYTVSPHVILAA